LLQIACHFFKLLAFFEYIEFKLGFINKKRGTKPVQVTILLKMSFSLQIWTWSYPSEWHRTNRQEKAWGLRLTFGKTDWLIVDGSEGLGFDPSTS